MLRQTFLDVDVGNEVCVRYDNAIGLALHQSAYRCVAHAGRHDTIHGGRRAAALDVAEDGNAGEMCIRDRVKKGLTPEEQENHPARFALAEIVNIHDESIIIEPIHRALFGVDGEELLKSLTAFYEAQGCKAYVADNAPETEGAHFYPFVSAEKNGVFVVEDPKWAIPVATIQTGLDAFLAEHKDVKIDFIHGADVVVSLAEKKGNFGFILPDIAKNDLFRGVVFDLSLIHI